MKQTFTPNDLIRFIYHEVTAEEESQIRNWIAEDAQGSSEFHLLMNSIAELDSFQAEPSETSIQLILEASREYSVEESHC